MRTANESLDMRKCDATLWDDAIEVFRRAGDADAAAPPSKRLGDAGTRLLLEAAEKRRAGCNPVVLLDRLVRHRNRSIRLPAIELLGELVDDAATSDVDRTSALNLLLRLWHHGRADVSEASLLTLSKLAPARYGLDLVLRFRDPPMGFVETNGILLVVVGGFAVAFLATGLPLVIALGFDSRDAVLLVEWIVAMGMLGGIGPALIKEVRRRHKPEKVLAGIERLADEAPEALAELLPVLNRMRHEDAVVRKRLSDVVERVRIACPERLSAELPRPSDPPPPDPTTLPRVSP